MPRSTTQYNIAGTDTFRLSSSMVTERICKPEREGQCGENLQNKDKKIKKIYKPDKGKVFVKRDQRGAEAMIVAYLTKHGQFRDLFLNGIKPHTYVALHLFKSEWQREVDKGFGGQDTRCSVTELCSTPISSLRRNPFWKEVAELIQSSDNWIASRRFYFISKQVCHSSNYGIGANRFCLNTLEKSQGKVVLSKRDASTYLDFYHSTFPEIREWHDEVLTQVKETNYLYNLFGYPKYFFHKGELDNRDIKKYIAWIPQSTVGTITNIAYTLMQNFIEQHDLEWDLLVNEHDSILMQCPVADAALCSDTLKLFIEQKMTNNRNEEFQMKSDVSVGYNWAPAHDEHNPEGLKDIFK